MQFCFPGRSYYQLY